MIKHGFPCIPSARPTGIAPATRSPIEDRDKNRARSSSRTPCESPRGITGGGTRTHTGATAQRILSPQRLPFRHAGLSCPANRLDRFAGFRNSSTPHFSPYFLNRQERRRPLVLGATGPSRRPRWRSRPGRRGGGAWSPGGIRRRSQPHRRGRPIPLPGDQPLRGEPPRRRRVVAAPPIVVDRA